MTAGLDPLAGLGRDLDHERVSAETITVEVPELSDLPGDAGQLRFLLYVGLFDLLAEAAFRAAATDGERTASIDRALGIVQSAEPTLRFALHEKATLADRQELVARMRGKEILLTEEWMVPRLHEDIAAYRARIESLRRALEEPDG